MFSAKVNYKEGPYVIYTPDCSKILVYSMAPINEPDIEEPDGMIYIYLNATNGSILSTVIRECCPQIRIKDGIAISEEGDRIYSVHSRYELGTVGLNRFEYDLTLNAFKKDYKYVAWTRNDYKVSNGINIGKSEKYAIALSPDFKKVFTFSSSASEENLS